ncbi:hypothetical protein SDRG_04747 [Saprolegnia diclina VS20]|uniref:Uncharacterized protein n=1 Tax=Saprolegnia diclina (strain VS20) TaxID=1156394 RepID=T0QUL4_SAPDV|nr:hypothetical protein SDRG_04747 [Saprolegnia diclina VS20]EQC37720.1 hypothetical protein SDRG_04747 [Saprolegnia diclina VS20]|eukprot:XP_008608653.1 hypothetical protein SDRG_04747 [Saprolegnia diclina VS20]
MVVARVALDVPVTSASVPWYQHALGVTYVAASIALSFAALEGFATYTATDYFWPQFGSTAPVLRQILNTNLSVLPATAFVPVDVFAPSATILGSLTSGVDTVYVRRLVYSDLTDLPSSIASLRTLNAMQVSELVSPYCWVDLDKVWELAYTSKRQARCVVAESSNAAVHLAAVLRNIDFDAWRHFTQGRFDAHVGGPIAATGPYGASWLDAFGDRSDGTGTAFGLHESVLVENALGIRLPWPLKTIPSVNRARFRNTCVFYDLLLNDLYAMSAIQSMVRSTTNYFADTTPDIMECYSVSCPLSGASRALHDQVGAIAALDAKWLTPPPAFVAAATAFRSQMITAFTASPTLHALLVAPAVLPLRPVQWADPSLRFVSGNPWCIYGAALPFVQQTLNFDDVCSRQMPLTLASSLVGSVFALTQLPHLEGAAACVAATDAAGCLAVFEAAQTLSRNLSVLPLDAAALTSLDIGLFQYVVHQTQLPTNSMAAPAVEMQPLLDATFAFFGWMMLYEWAIGEREVISLQGDVQTMNIISVAYPAAVSSVPPAPTSLGPYLWYFAAMTSGVLGAVGAAAIVLGYGTRFTLWGMFNPIVSSVWMARHPLAARGTLACICLATAPTSVLDSSKTLQLDPRPRALWASLTLSSEALWLLCLWYEVVLPILRRPAAKMLVRCAACAFVALVGLDQGWPVTWSVFLGRLCDLNDLTVVTCSSGSVAVGSWHRLVVVGLVLLGVAVGAALLSRPERQAVLHRLLPLSLRSCVKAGTVELDGASAFLCGVIPFSICGVAYVADVKLWRVLVCDAYDVALRRRSIAFANRFQHSVRIRATPATRQRKLMHHVPLLVTGLGYLVATLSSNVAYLSVMSESLANDFGWSGFNTSGTHAFLASTFTSLAMSSIDIPDLILDTPTLGVPAYSDAHDATQWQPNLARRQLFDDASITLTTVVDGLRSMDPCQLPWMFTQYCWLDFGRKWAMASSAARQARCVSSMSLSGAVYLEAPLRNLNDWSAWQRCWGRSFEIGVGSALQTSATGRQWLSALTAGFVNSVDDEVSSWRASGLSTFRLQWQNYKTTGFDDAIEVTTAWGLSYPLTIATFPPEMHTDRQTSMRMYWSLASDLWAVATNDSGIGGASLLRASATYAFTNTTPEQLLFVNTTLVTPLQAGLCVLRDTLGPFGVVDMVYISVPPPLQQLYVLLNSAVANVTTTDSLAQSRFAALPEKAYVGVTPWELLHATNPPGNVGGNLVCGSDLEPVDTSIGLTAFVGFETQCSWWRSEVVAPSSLQLLFALVAMNATSVLDPTLDFDQFCAADAFPEPTCATIHADVYDFAVAYTSALPLAPLATAVHSTVDDLGIVVAQYLRNASSHVELYQRRLFNSSDDRAWPFFGWCFLFDWVVGMREVVSFQGDLGVVRPITAATSPVVIVLDPTEIPTALSFVFRTSAQYVTVVLIGVTGLIVCYTMTSLGAIDAFSLFDLNRIVGHVWVGRLLLVVRSATALWLLNTSGLTLQKMGTSAMLQVPSTPSYKVVLVESELTWLVYVLNDLLSGVTQQYTPSYAWKSSLLTWAVAVGCQAPRRYSASLHRRCVYDNMDAGLVCTTGSITIGHLSGVGTGVVIALCAIVGTAAILERWRLPALSPMTLQTLYLSSASYFALSPDAGTVGTDIDPVFALMAGLVSLRWRGKLYAFDIKSWRSVPCHDDVIRDVLQASVARRAGTSSSKLIHVQGVSAHDAP